MDCLRHPSFLLGLLCSGVVFEQKVLTEALHDLSMCIKQDGNDGAHDGSFTEHDAHDILDSAFLLLERLYTEQKCIEDARARQLARRNH